MKKIAVIGSSGYVGRAVDNFFANHFEVVPYDVAIHTEAQKEAVNTCDLAVVCVPTPQREDGSVDISIVEETVRWLAVPLILIKSTVPPGTTERLVAETGKQIAFSPEYIGEGRYVVQWWKDRSYPHPTDMKYHDFQIFGGERKTTSAIIPFFQKVLGPEAKYLQTNARTAELTKYMENSWGYMKVMFCNEFYDIAQAFGVDYHELRELFLQDGRTERMHTAVFTENRKVGGKCFPKDVNGIINASTIAGHDPKLLRAVVEKNKEIA